VSGAKGVGADVVGPTEYLFHLQTRDRVYSLAARSAEDARLWVDSLRASVTARQDAAAGRSPAHRAPLAGASGTGSSRSSGPAIQHGAYYQVPPHGTASPLVGRPASPSPQPQHHGVLPGQGGGGSHGWSQVPPTPAARPQRSSPFQRSPPASPRSAGGPQRRGSSTKLQPVSGSSASSSNAASSQASRQPPSLRSGLRRRASTPIRVEKWGGSNGSVVSGSATTRRSRSGTGSGDSGRRRRAATRDLSREVQYTQLPPAPLPDNGDDSDAPGTSHQYTLIPTRPKKGQPPAHQVHYSGLDARGNQLGIQY
jgi:hypothetical protein